SHLGAGDHGPKTDRSRPRSVPVNAMTQSEVPRSGSPSMADRFGPGHFRLGRLNEAAGVCGGRGTYGYSIDLETSGSGSLRPVRVESALPCIENGGINGPGSLNGPRFAANGAR